MKIIRLQASNFKRLTAVDIIPRDAVIEITGKNGAGKTSVLDAMWAALGGKDAAPPMPIRSGEEEARISLDLGELKVVRKFHAKDGGAFTTSLVVESAEGARFASPQGVLDALVGSLTFDPLHFQRMPAKEQFATCRAFVPGIDFDQIDRLNRGDFEKRRDINRDAERAAAEAQSVRVATDAPAEPIDEAPVLRKLAAAGEIDSKRRRRQADRLRVDRLKAQIEEAQAEIQRTEALLEAEGEPEDADPEALNCELAKIRNLNASVAAAKKKAEAQARADALKAEADALTKAMAKRTADAAKAVAAAKMPVPGLGFGEGMVLLGGVPFEQASDSEQLRASIAIAAAMNPRLKVVRVRDGSLLDADAFRILEGFAAEHDLQVWIETVQSGRGHAVLIENGEVASAPAPIAEDAPSEEII